eukprot:TRINITY_DN3657_c0_g1_i2.p1 TRINITY_DN3657_c0_g1~~TRINITY_DN3657_c0_g1_i2.p1  ORF type:complete len:102 (+),score=19.15 TRINITY_DN3657_c0_g1_i2:99-404(+)
MDCILEKHREEVRKLTQFRGWYRLNYAEQRRIREVTDQLMENKEEAILEAKISLLFDYAKKIHENLSQKLQQKMLQANDIDPKKGYIALAACKCETKSFKK